MRELQRRGVSDDRVGVGGHSYGAAPLRASPLEFLGPSLPRSLLSPLPPRDRAWCLPRSEALPLGLRLEACVQRCMFLFAETLVGAGYRKGFRMSSQLSDAWGGARAGGFMAANLLAHSDTFKVGVGRSGAYNRLLTP